MKPYDENATCPEKGMDKAIDEVDEAEQKATRAAIEARWSSRILDARARLCAGCEHGVGPEPGRDCEMSLLPVTLAGADCPYWQGKGA